MAATKLFFENHLSFPIYVLLRSVAGVLEIHLHGETEDGAMTAGSGQRISFPVNDLVKRCLRNGKLEYVVHLHLKTTRQIEFDGGREKLAEGPIFQIHPVVN